MCETVWLFSWVNTHPFDLKFVAFYPEFSGDPYVEFQEKTISGEYFRNFCVNQGYHYRNLWHFALLSAIFFYVCIMLKKFTQVLSYVVWIHVRRHFPKRITKRRHREEKQGGFHFGKLVLFTLGLRLTTPYSLGALLLNLYQTFVTVSIDFWPRFELQIRSTRLPITFLFNTIVSETVWFFSWVNTHPFELKFFAFLSQI